MIKLNLREVDYVLNEGISKLTAQVEHLFAPNTNGELLEFIGGKEPLVFSLRLDYYYIDEILKSLEDKLTKRCDRKKSHKKGVYFFEIKTNQDDSLSKWLESFSKKWQMLGVDKIYSPNIINKRIKKYEEENFLPEWMPLYLGISKELFSRIKEHINLKFTQTTYALKLKERDNLKDETFRVRFIEVETEYYDLLLPRLESILRDKLNPIVGKQ